MLQFRAKCHLAGVQAYAAVRVGAPRSVFEVALDGAADGCKLAADLVMAAGEQFHLHQKIFPGRTQQAVAQQGLLGSGLRLRMAVGLVLLLVTGEPGADLPFRRYRGILHQGPIDLPCISLPEGGGEAGQGLGGLGQDDGSADRTVEAVGHTHEHLAGLPVAEGDESLEFLDQGLVAGLVALDYLAGALVQDKYVIVLIEDAGGDVLRLLRGECPVWTSTARCHWGNHRILHLRCTGGRP